MSMYSTRTRSTRNAPRRKLPPAASELELVQRYAALAFEQLVPGLGNRTDKATGAYGWMLREEADKDLGITAASHPRNGYFIDAYRFLQPDRGEVPHFCPQGTACSECREAPATIAMFANREYGMAYVCNDLKCITAAERRICCR